MEDVVRGGLLSAVAAPLLLLARCHRRVTRTDWERASGSGHEFAEIIADDVLDGPAVVDIAATDVRFTSSGCGNWTSSGP